MQKIDFFLKKVIDEICQRNRGFDASGFGLKPLSEGGDTGKIWEIDSSRVLKVFYLGAQNMPSVFTQMRGEVAAYKTVYENADPSPLPILSSYGEIPSARQQGAACGWLILSKIPGKVISFDGLEQMPLPKRDEWIHGLVGEMLKVEKALVKAKDHCAIWDEGYADSRFRLIQNNIPDISNDDRTLTSSLVKYIQAEPVIKQYSHGDIHPTNILTEEAHTKQAVHLIDPQVRFDAPEASFRHLTIIPDFLGAVIDEYQKQKNIELNSELVYAYGALTHHFNHLRKPSAPDDQLRQNWLKHCLSHIDL